jgi:hypothetical protein
VPVRQISSRVSAALTQRTRWRSLVSPQGTTPFGGQPPAATLSSSERFNPPRKPVVFQDGVLAAMVDGAPGRMLRLALLNRGGLP